MCEITVADRSRLIRWADADGQSQNAKGRPPDQKVGQMRRLWCTDAAGIVQLLAEVGIAAANLQHRRRALHKTQTPFRPILAAIFCCLLVSETPLHGQLELSGFREASGTHRHDPPAQVLQQRRALPADIPLILHLHRRRGLRFEAPIPSLRVTELEVGRRDVGAWVVVIV